MNGFTLDFIGVGAAKGGTTWLAACLAEHPQICMSNPKELNFFCRRHVWPPSPTFYDNGEGWLRERFSHWKTGQKRGEFSVSYLIDTESPGLIHAHFPSTKIIISCRSPIDGLYSFFFELAKQYSVPETFEDFLDHYPDFIDYGFYYRHIERYFRFFALEQIHAIIFDDICRNPSQVLSDLFEFLGVASDYKPGSLNRKVNVRKTPRHLLVRNFVGNTTDFLRTHPQTYGIKRFLRLLGAHRIAKLIQTRNLHVTDFPAMKTETRSRLLDTYAEENVLLGNLLNRDLSHWNR